MSPSVPKIWVDYYRELSVISILPLPVLLYFFSIFPSLFSYMHLNWSIHLVLDHPLGCFPLILVCSIFLGILSSVIRITCPNHLYLLFCMPFLVSSSPSSNIMLVSFILCFFVLFKSVLNNFISMAWILLSSLFCCCRCFCSI